jgi:hypothetical protein
MSKRGRIDSVESLYEKGFRELQVTGAGAVDALEELEGTVSCLEARIALLEEVAEAAEAYSHLNGEGTCDELAAYYAARDKLDDELRAAGYLKEQENGNGE